MAFLTINGIELHPLVDTFEETPREIGERDFAYNGTGVISRQGTKRDVSFETWFVSPTEGRALDKFIRGEGHVWAFGSTGFYSSKGLKPNSGYVATQTGSGGKFAGKLTVSATTGTITYATQLGTTWALMYWRYESAAWHHHIVNSDGVKYLDGAVDVGSTSYIAVSSGSVTITNVTGSGVDYSDLVVLPFVVPASWAAIFGVSATAFSLLPALSVAGDFDPEARTMLGEVSSGSLHRAIISGVSYSNARKLKVTMREQ